MSPIRLSRELTAQGFSSSELARLTRNGELERVRHGAYAEPLVDADPRTAHLRLLRATVQQSAPDLVVSHMSAAALHGLPLWDAHLTRVQLTRDGSGGGQRRRYGDVHGLRLPASDVTEVDGLLVTTLARTVLDLACSLPMTQSVAIGDAALRRKLSGDELEEQLDRAARRTGVGAARRTIAFLDPRSETPGESVSRVVFAQLGLPKPELQVDIWTWEGEWIARCDFDWPEWGTVGEFDGKVKYGRALQPGRSIEDVVFDEKVREDRIRDTGKQMVRWIWADLRATGHLADRLQRAFHRGRRRA